MQATKRKYRTRAEIKQHLKEWKEMEAAGIAKGDYCKSIDVPESTFNYWLKSVPSRNKRPAETTAAAPRPRETGPEIFTPIIADVRAFEPSKSEKIMRAVTALIDAQAALLRAVIERY